MIKKLIFGLVVFIFLFNTLVLAGLEPEPTDDPIPIPDPKPPENPIPIDFESRSFSGHKGSFDYDITITKLSQNGNDAIFFYDVGICETVSPDTLEAPEVICLVFASLNSEGKVTKNNDAWVINDDFVKSKLYQNSGNLKVDGYPSVFVETKIK